MEVFRQKATCNSLSPCVRICIMSISVMAKPKRERRWNVWPTYDPTRHATIFGRVTSYDPICLLVGQSVSWLVGRSAVVIISKKGVFFSKLPVPSPRAHLLFFVQQSSPPVNNRNVGSQYFQMWILCDHLKVFWTTIPQGRADGWFLVALPLAPHFHLFQGNLCI